MHKQGYLTHDKTFDTMFAKYLDTCFLAGNQVLGFWVAHTSEPVQLVVAFILQLLFRQMSVHLRWQYGDGGRGPVWTWRLEAATNNPA